MRPVALVLCTLTTLLFASFAAAVPDVQAVGPRMDSGERAVLRAINRARAFHGLRRLHADRRLARAADAHTRNMLRADFFAHGAFAQRVRRYIRVPVRAVGETLAYTSRCSARTVVRMWLNSPSHRAVVLSGLYRRLGVGRRVGRLGGMLTCMVTADFSSRR